MSLETLPPPVLALFFPCLPSVLVVLPATFSMFPVVLIEFPVEGFFLFEIGPKVPCFHLLTLT